MRGGSLQRALQDPDQHEALAWHNRCAGGAHLVQCGRHARLSGVQQRAHSRSITAMCHLQEPSGRPSAPPLHASHLAHPAGACKWRPTLQRRCTFCTPSASSCTPTCPERELRLGGSLVCCSMQCGLLLCSACWVHGGCAFRRRPCCVHCGVAGRHSQHVSYQLVAVCLSAETCCWTRISERTSATLVWLEWWGRARAAWWASTGSMQVGGCSACWVFFGLAAAFDTRLAHALLKALSQT